MHFTPFTFSTAFGKLHVLNLLVGVYNLLCDDLPVQVSYDNFVLFERAILFGFKRLQPTMIHVRSVLEILGEHQVIIYQLTPIVSSD